MLRVGRQFTRHPPLRMSSCAFSSEKPPDDDDQLRAAVIAEYRDRKWGKGPAIGQAWPTDRPLNAAVEPVPELQDHWKALERRVGGRRPLGKRGEAGSGRKNVRRSEEDYWLDAGAYDGISVAPASPKEPPASGDGAASQQPSSSTAPAALGLLAGIPPGAAARCSVVAVRSPAHAAAFADAYSAKVAPVVSGLAGFQRTLLMHDPRSSTLHVIVAWRGPSEAEAAGRDPAYVSAQAEVAETFFAGPPAVTDLGVLAEFGPSESEAAPDHPPIRKVQPFSRRRG